MSNTISLSPTYLGTERRPPGWPSDYPRYTIAALCLGLLTILGILTYQYTLQWNALQRHYLLHYILSSSKLLSGEARRYRLLETVRRNGRLHLTEDWEVLPVKEPTVHDPNFLPFTLSPQAIGNGAVSLQWIWDDADNAKLHRFLRERVYHWNSFGDSLYPACWWGLGVFAVTFGFALPRDKKAAEVRRQGRVVRGPLVVTRDEFNRTRLKKGRTDGIGLVTEEPETVRERVFVRRKSRSMVRIPREDEPKHFLLEGGTGSGKTLAMMQMLSCALDRGYIAIIHDPTCEYVERFYSPERGDIILNPTDARSPSWNPSDEVIHDPEALTIAHALFPDQPRETPFFLTSVRKLFAHLLRIHLKTEQLIELMCDPSKIDELVAGTPYASLIRDTAPQQREGIIATMSHVADTIRLLMGDKDAPGKWMAREWAKNPKGCLFLTSTGETRDALRPLISVWFDLLVLWMLNRNARSKQLPVWFFLDEVASLHKLPQLETALTMNRKSNNTVVLGLQGKAQLETIYGHISETMIAMPWTALFFKTTEPNAAEWISKYLGEQEIERLRESRTDGTGSPGRNRASKTYMLERLYRYPVIASQISGLPARQGYLKSGNLIVPLTLKEWDLPKLHEGFIPRDMGPMFPVQPKSKDGDPEGERSRQRDQKRKRGQDRKFLD